MPPPEGFRLDAIALADLNFGTVLPGVPVSVSPSSSHAGVFQIVGPVSATVRIELILPASLRRQEHFLPLSFGPGEATAGHGRAPEEQFISFSPGTPLVTSLSAAGKLYIRLGGTVLPGLPQAGGEYEGFITITVYDLGS